MTGTVARDRVAPCTALLQLLPFLLALAIGALPLAATAALTQTDVPVLVYHRFGAQVTDAMTVRTSTFAAQLTQLEHEGFAFIPSRWLVEYRRGERTELPTKSIVITADDGHASVYTEMLPLARRFRVPVTLFIYPSVISNAPYAMTWQQLRELQDSGWFDIQAHTYWHPNFRIERKRLSPAAYRTFVRAQLVRAKAVLEAHMGRPASLLAWPFGLYDEVTIDEARAAGYQAAVALGGRPTKADDALFALPRILVVDGTDMRWLHPTVAAPTARQTTHAQHNTNQAVRQ